MVGTIVEQCTECGFAAGEWNNEDTVNTLLRADRLVARWVEGTDPRRLNDRPTPDTWSVTEYTDHIRETIFGGRFLTELAIEDPGRDLGAAIAPSPAGRHRLLDLDDRLAALDEETDTFGQLLGTLTSDQWNVHVVVGGVERTVTWASRHSVHDLWHHLGDLARIRAQLGDPVPRQTGTLEQVNRSDGGVPKTAVVDAEIDRSGVVGDRQQARMHHGRPWQALCLWSADVIDDLVREGHPIAPGAAGENLTLRGIDWSDVRSGAVIEIGDVVCQLSAPATPCAKNNRWFADRDSQRIHHDRHRGWARWYASVLRPGRVAPGDPVDVR